MACCCKKTLLALVVFLAVVAFLPDTKTYFGFDVKITKRKVSELPDSFSGPLLANKLLNQADKLFQGEIVGPESLAEFNGDIYATLEDGRIVQILPDSYRTVTRFDPLGLGPDCALLRNLDKCGRPVGAQFDSKGLLFTNVASSGVYLVNVTTGEQKLVVPASKLDGSKLLNDIDFIEKQNGHKVFYLSESTHKYSIAEIGSIMAEGDTSGRLLSFDTETGAFRVELDNLDTPNGIAITADRKSLLLSSTFSRLIYKYSISGPEKGQLEILFENLPGEPDQIRRSKDGARETYWVGIFAARNARKPNFALDTLLVKTPPLVLRFIFRLQRLIGFSIEKFGILLKSQKLEEIGLDVKLGLSVSMGACTYGMALEITPEGEIVNSLHSPDGSVCTISEVREIEPKDPANREFYLGSPVNAYVGKLVLPKSAFKQGPASSPNKVVPKKVPTQEQPKPESKKQEPKKPVLKQNNDQKTEL